ncbi:MAG: hypothetical protein ACRD4M_14140, partial [Candidatus Acidiferrales bacterium]
ADQPGHYREQRETIRREAILAMVLRVESALPAHLKVRVTMRRPAGRTKSKKAKKKKREKSGSPRKSPRATLEIAFPLLDLFREEFFVALGQALRWSEDDAQDFWHDLELYEKLSAQQTRPRSRSRVHTGVSGPFVDRTALLLDPSLMEQARRAAGKFQWELDSAADRVLRKVFSRRRSN